MGLFVRDEEACQSFRPRRYPTNIETDDYALAVVAAWQAIHGSSRTTVRICDSGQGAFRYGEQVVIQRVLFTLYCRVMPCSIMPYNAHQSIVEIWFLWPEDHKP